MADAVVRVVDNRAVVVPFGSELLSPLIALAQRAVTEAQDAATGAEETAAGFSSVTGMFLTQPDGTNLYDPALSTAQLGKGYGVTGTTYNDSTYAVTGRIPVTAGQVYTLDIRNAAAPWFIEAAALFFNDDGTFHSRTTAGASLSFTTVSGLNKTATFTVPTGAEAVGFSLPYFNSGNPSAADFAELRHNIQLSVGTSVTTLEPYRAAGTKQPGPEIVGPLVVQRVSPYLYVRSPYDAAFDLVERVTVGRTPSYSMSGTVDPGACRKVARSWGSSETATAWIGSPFQMALSGDDAAPVWINSTPLGGNHGLPGQSITATAHGKANADVGSKWTDGAAKVWVLARIENANTLVIVPELGGTATAWTAVNTLTGTALTHASGATNTGAITLSSPVATQLYPWVQSYTYSIWVDGKEVVADGTYSGKVAVINERYGIPNAASVVADLVANAGSSAAPTYNKPGTQTQVEVDATFTFKPGELTKVDYQLRNVQAYSSGRFVGVQAGFPNRTGTDKLWLYASGMGTETTTGLNFTSAPRDITAGLGNWVDFNTAEWLSPTDPPDRIVEIIRTSGGFARWGLVTGLSKRLGSTVPATRAALLSTAVQLSPAGKMYPIAAGIRSMAAGEVFNVPAYRGIFDASAAGATANFVYSDGNKQVWVLDIHATASLTWYQLPYALRNALIGSKLTVVDKSASLTLHSAFVGQRGAQITTTGGYGWLIAEIG